MKAWFNAMQNIKFDDLDLDGHYPRLDDDALSNEPGNIKSEFYGLRDALRVVVQQGLVVRLRGGTVTLPTGAMVSIASQNLSLPDNATRLIFVDASGAVQISGSAPATGVLLAEVQTSGGAITFVKDLRPRISYQVAPLSVPNTPTFVMPSGVIVPFAGNVTPSGWLLCDGTLYSISTHPTLFSAIGNRYGGDGVTTFRVPATADLTLVGASASKPLASTGGRSAASISEGNLPPHRHNIIDPGHSHSITDGGHTHPVQDPGHRHNINDPGHDHQLRNVRYAALNGQDNDGNGAELSNQGTGIHPSTQNSTTGITLQNAITGVSVQSASSNVVVNASGTGISMQTVGGGIPLDIQNPYLALNFIIKI